MKRKNDFTPHNYKHTHKLTYIKNLFYFVHGANAFVMLRFSFEDESLNVGSFYDFFLAFLNLLINEHRNEDIPNRNFFLISFLSFRFSIVSFVR